MVSDKKTASKIASRTTSSNVVFRLLTIALLLLIAPFFQNCKGFKPVQNSDFSNSGQVGRDTDSPNLPGTDTSKDIKNSLVPNLIPNCFSNRDYNACIFWKNPVAQLNSPLSSPVTGSSNLRSIQTHAVNINGFDNSGFLRNSTMRIYSFNTATQRFESLPTTGNSFKYAFGNDSGHKFSQVMAYHWLNTQEKLMTEWTGRFFAKNKAIYVLTYVPDIENSYWDPGENEIIIGSSPNGNEFSLSAEVYAHEMGHSNVYYATNGAIFETVGSAKSIGCNESVCCKDTSGCSWAIDEGLSDYHHAMLFPQDTDILETFTNTNQGLLECGLTRSLDDNRNLSSAAAYAACTGGYEGEVHLMGRIYASVWWEVRKTAKSLNKDGEQEIDVLFTNHLLALEGRDDFQTALDKIIATDKALFGGRYSNLFVQEFARRGISQ